MQSAQAVCIYCSSVVEPFDEALAARVRTLSDRVDEVTEQVVARRRTVPTEYAHAIARHSAALDSLTEVHEEQRRADILRGRKRPRFEAIAAGRPVGNTESRTRAAETLGKSFTQLRDLPIVRESLLTGNCVIVHLQQTTYLGSWRSFGAPDTNRRYFA